MANKAFADSQIGIAMVGAPKYDAHDTHLSYAKPDAPIGGTLRQTVTNSFDTLNPHGIKGKAASGLHLITDRLMQRVWDEPFTLYGLIAESIDVPEDRSAITFHLNKAARFHDGTPITAKDVAFTLRTLREKGRPNARRVYKQVESTTIIDDHTIKLELDNTHDRETVMILAMMPVLAQHVWQDRSFEETSLQPYVSSGPYKIAAIDAGRSITYQRVDDYWAKDHLTRLGHNNFQTIRYDSYRDETVAFEAFLSDEADIRRESDPTRLSQDYQGKTIHGFAHQRPAWMKGFIMNMRRAPLDNASVREALLTSFDYSWANKTLMAGKARQATGLFSHSPLSSDTKLAGDGLSSRERLRRSDALLTQAGWSVRNGVRVGADDKPLALTLILNNAEEEKIALYWARNLKRLGITLTIRTLDTAQFIGALNDYDYDLISHRWINSLSPGTEQVIYWSCEAAKQPGGRNYAGICDEDIDSLAKSVAQARTQAALTKAAKALDKAVMETYPMIPLGGLDQDYFIMNETIGFPETTPLYGPIIETWWKKAP